MKRRYLIGAALLACMTFRPMPSHAVNVNVSLDLSHINFTNSKNLTIQATNLAPQVFVYKPIVFTNIHISRRDGGSVNTNGLLAELVYQVFNDQGLAVDFPTSVAISLVRDGRNFNNLIGTAFVPPEVIRQFRAGYRLTYYIRVGNNTWGDPNAPFSTSVIDTMAIPVTPNNAVSFNVPDTYQASIPTEGLILQGVLPSQTGTLLIHQEPPETAIARNGQAPVVQFSMRYDALANVQAAATGVIFRFNELPLNGPFHITMSYPATKSGSVFMFSGGPDVRATDLAPYCYQSNSWQLADRPQIDTTLHTVTFTTSKLSSCALFATGPVGAADVRPRQRIITPNGDGINDTVSFNGVTNSDQVKIFDVRGRRIREMSGPNPTWDGRDDNGSIVESGVYIYQYTSQGERVSGVIVVAK